MTKRGLSILIVVLAIILTGGFFLLRDAGPADTPDNANGGTQNGTSTAPVQTSMVRVSSPLPNALVSSPLTVTGEARGNWYFEASFPLRVVDANGRELGVSYAQAEGDPANPDGVNWMTTEFVPFRGTITFASSTTATGFLILEKDNPSGLPENAAEVRVPIRFSQAAASRTPIQDAIRALLAEWNLPGVTLDAASLNNGVLTLTFSDPQFKTSGGAARVTQMRGEIEATAKQFPGVTRVIIKPDDIFQP